MNNASPETKTAAGLASDKDLLDALLAGAGGNPSLSAMAAAVAAAYAAFDNKVPPSLPGYDVVATIDVFEIAAGKPVLFGFAAAAQDGSHNLVALRGTQTHEEDFFDVDDWGVLTPVAFTEPNGTVVACGNAMEGLYNFYVGTDLGAVTSLAESLKAAVGKLDSSVPLFMGAHSLGGAMANLGALDVAVSGTYGGKALALVTFGGLQVGDSAFGQAYRQRGGFAVRIVNLCDFVPAFVGLTKWSASDPCPYEPVGLAAAFGWQTWDVWANHSLVDAYQVVVDQSPQDMVLFDKTGPFPGPLP